MPIFDNIGGIQHKVNKSFSNVNGIWVPNKKVFDNVGGMWKQTYTSAIEWTHEISYFKAGTGGISDRNQHSISLESYDKGAGGTVTYRFRSPLVLPAGSTLEYLFFSSTYQRGILAYLFINEDRILNGAFSSPQSGTEDTITYPNTYIVNYLTVGLKADGYINAYADVTITPAGGKSFKLTFLDSAEQ